MLGIFLIYFIGKQFFDLIGLHKKDKTSQWVYAILGIVSYYIGIFLGSFILAFGEIYGLWNISHLNEIVIGLMSIPTGILTVIIFYQILKRNLNKQKQNFDANIIDEEFKF